MTVSKDFPLALSWCTQFFLLAQFSWRNLQNKMTTFLNLKKNWKIPILRGKFLNQKCIFNFFPQAYLLVLSERIVLHPKTFTLDIRQGYLSTITISCFLSSTIQIQQLDYPISATVSQFSNRPSISSCIKTRIKNTFELGGKKC